MNAINRKQLIGLVVFLAVALLFADLLVGPPLHAVHSFGGSAVTPRVYSSQQAAAWWPLSPPTQTLAEVKCVEQRAPQAPCTPADISTAFPGLSQTEHTLYVVWGGCVSFNYQTGFNLEYFSSTRTLVIHCYKSEGWLSPHDVATGALAFLPSMLFAIPTSAIGTGLIQIDEDDRIEHLIGDQSYEYRLAAVALH